jgi:nicotinamidase-related amidase
VVLEEGADRNGSTDPAVLERFSREVEVLAKTTFGLAESGEIVDALRGKSRGTIVLTGFDADVCVAQSALGLQREGFRPIVVDDAVYSSRAIHHPRGLERVRQAGVEVNHCRGLACEWIREVELADQVVEETRKFGKAPLVPRAYSQAGPGSE